MILKKPFKCLIYDFRKFIRYVEVLFKQHNDVCGWSGVGQHYPVLIKYLIFKVTLKFISHENLLLRY